MNCPNCGSNQTNNYSIRAGYFFIECANCDGENYVDLSSELFADAVDQSKENSYALL